MATPLRVLVVDDDPATRDSLALGLKRAGFPVELARHGEEALRRTHPGAFDIAVVSLHLSGVDGPQFLARLKAVDPALPVLLITGPGEPGEALALGAFDILPQPFTPEELTAAMQKTLISEEHLRTTEPAEAPLLLTRDRALGEALALARRAADSRATILIQAERGAGKEMLARLIHGSSPRHSGPFVTFNCAALPEDLLEAELFGLEKGGHPGSIAKASCFEQADGGTLVLEAVEALPLGLQDRLLRVLQDRTVERLGGSRAIPVDVRLISLSSRDLLAEVKAGRFAEDLYYRLNVIPLNLPPLRERLGDLELLAAHFAERCARENDRAVPSLAPSFLAALARHPWTGNLRELENVIQRCVVLNQGHRLSQQDLRWLLPPEAFEGLPADPLQDAAGSWAPPAPDTPQGEARPLPPGAVVADPRKPLVGLALGTPVVLPLGLSLPELERFWLLSTLSALKGNRTHSAAQLDIALRTVRNKINEYKADGFAIPPSTRGGE
ncbi:sigma-54-dependent transcriptional regulator [Geothrix mesophila]|uniref:sigma-54-dependent transcriptional regulator n=1 Tax=Geothrix mesophila TaxID=2922723 RepID=UPI001FADD0CF|nr:sigma-54 dependent transcriptional regulator [Geothrix sp. SG198]